jgi:hypothetical protein
MPPWELMATKGTIRDALSPGIWTERAAFRQWPELAMETVLRTRRIPLVRYRQNHDLQETP